MAEPKPGEPVGITSRLIHLLFSRATAQIKPWLDEQKRASTIDEMIDRIEHGDSDD